MFEMILQEFLEKYVINRRIEEVWFEYYMNRFSFEMESDPNELDEKTELSFAGVYKLTRDGEVITVNDNNVDLESSVEDFEVVEGKKIIDFKVDENNDITIKIEDGYIFRLMNFQMPTDMAGVWDNLMYYLRIFHWDYDVIFEHHECRFRKNSPEDFEITKKGIEKFKDRNEKEQERNIRTD